MMLTMTNRIDGAAERERIRSPLLGAMGAVLLVAVSLFVATAPVGAQSDDDQTTTTTDEGGGDVATTDSTEAPAVVGANPSDGTSTVTIAGVVGAVILIGLAIGVMVGRSRSAGPEPRRVTNVDDDGGYI